tara:strand:- start:1130 stop:2587 length:1458 start_codon:yes stop_codon:yes gene_type:complete
VNQEKANINLTNWDIVGINPNDKNWSSGDIFCFWANNIQSLIGFSLIASLYLVYDLNIIIVLIACLFAGILVAIFSNLIGHPSQKYGLPFPVILRSAFGISGARYISMLRGIVGLFMFGVQTFFISKSIGYLVRIFIFNIDNTILQTEIFLIFFMGMDLIDWGSFIFALILQFYLFKQGQNFIKNILNFSAWFVYTGLIVFIIILAGENSKEIINAFKLSVSIEDPISRENIFALISVTGTLFAFFSIVILNIGDYSRYVKNSSENSKGNYSIIINLLIFSFASVFIVLGADIVMAKQFLEVEQLLTNPTDIIGKIDNSYLTTIAILFILVASGSTNMIANYIPTQNALLNFFPKNLDKSSSGLLIIILGLIFGGLWLPILSQSGVLSIIDTIGSFFGPIAGIIIADYYFIKNKKYVSKDIFSDLKSGAYFYTGGWQIKGLYSMIIGFIFAASTIWNNELRFLQSFAWLIGALTSYIIYYLLASD